MSSNQTITLLYKVGGKMKNYLVLCGRPFSEKRKAQPFVLSEQLKKVVQERNQKSQDVLAVPLTIKDSGEARAVYSSADSLFQDIFPILEAVRPQKYHFSCAIGPLETPLSDSFAGPALDTALENIQGIKKWKTILSINGCGEYTELMNTSLQLLSHSIRTWKKNRFQVLALLMNNKKVKEIANRVGLSDKAIYKTIDNGGLKIILSLFNELEVKMNEFIGKE